jgi:hypothetical protein
VLFKLQNQLEAAVGPKLMSSFQNHETELVKSYYTIFEQIQRKDEFKSYYLKMRKGPILQKWNGKMDLNNSQNVSSISTLFNTSLNWLYEEIFHVIKQEVTYDYIYIKCITYNVYLNFK